MLEISTPEITAWVGRYMWPMFRISGFMLAAPFFGANFVPQRIRLLLAFAVSIMIAPILPPVPRMDPLAMEHLLLILNQVLIGVCLGFVLQLLTQLFVLAGQVISMKMGLGFAMMNDPSNGVSVAVVSQFYLLMVTLIFLASNGHLVAIEILVESFYTIPVNVKGLTVEDLRLIPLWGSWMFAGAVLMSLPAIVALTIVNMAFGVMSRAAPQMNMFALGFPLTLIFGLFVMWVTQANISTLYLIFVTDVLEFMRLIIKA
jgi:flagellar biosynthetic protein FliR